VIVSGNTRIEIVIEPASEMANIKTVTFSVNGRLACMLERPPFTTCSFEPGDVVRGHHIRVVATLTDGRRLVDNVRTRDIGYAERIRTSAVLVPLIVTDGGVFVRGLKQQDFELFEDGVKQPIASLVSDNVPLDLVLAIDVSGSMESALGDVKAAVKQLLAEDPSEVKALLQELHDEDIADLINLLQDDEAAKLLKSLKAEEAASIFGRLDEETQETLVKSVLLRNATAEKTAEARPSAFLP